jgi:hypothetical protein
MKIHRFVLVLSIFILVALSCSLPTIGSGGSGLNLSDANLGAKVSTSFTIHRLYTYEGVDKTGSPLKVVSETLYMEQTEPQWSSYSMTSLNANGQPVGDSGMEGAYQNGKNYAIGGGKCWVNPDKTSHESGFNPGASYLQDMQGTARQAQKGVNVYNVTADRYTLDKSNLRWFEHEDGNLKSANLYVAEKEGYFLRYDGIFQMNKPNLSDIKQKDFDPNKPILITFAVEQNFFSAGTLKVKIPALCANSQ